MLDRLALPPAALLAALLHACASPGADGPGGSTPSDDAGGPARATRPAFEASARPSRSGLRAAAIGAIQADAGEAFAWRLRDGVARASSGSMRLRVGSGTLRAERANAWSLRLTTVGLGRRTGWRELAPADAVVVGNALQIRRDALLERWVHGPLGVEHLYTVARRPEGEGALRIAIEVRGLSARPTPDGTGALFVDARERPRARYAELWVHDARGRALPARMRVEAGRIELRIDDAGAEYPLVVDPLLAALEDTLTPPTDEAGGWFGFAVALSDDGSRAIVGAPLTDESSFEGSTGSAYVFTRGAGGTWSREAVLTAPDALANASFGSAVALNGDATRALVGAPQDDRDDSNAGAAYFFVRSGTTWTHEATIRHPSPFSFDLLGQGVALDDAGTRAVIGVPGDDPDVANADRGTALVYALGGGGWSLEATLAGAGATDDAALGQAVAIDDTGSRILAGAPGDTASSSLAGSARVFVRSGTTWTEEEKLVPTDERSGERFGHAVALSGDASRALVGAPDDRIGSFARGGGWIFARSGTSWSLEAHLFASSGSGTDDLGTSVSLSGDGTRAALGAPLDDTSAGADAGRVRLFSLDGASWTEGDVLEAPGAAGDERFGYAVAIAQGGASVLGGAYRQEGSVPLLGAGHVFTLEHRLGDGAACSADGECESGFCTDGVCCNISCYGDCRACSVAAGGSTDGVCTALSEAAASAEVCRPAAGPCDVAESCVAGSMACPADGVADAATVCRPAAADCDVAERCSGSSVDCPMDAFEPSTTVCRPAAGECDVAERCTGASAECPADAFEPTGTSCGSSASGPCDAADTCDGAGACLANVSPNGTFCNDGAFCTTESRCDGGICAATAGDPCGADEVCNETVDMCLLRCGDGEMDAGEECDDGAGNSDTTPDACRTTCALPSCGDGVTDTGEACDDGSANSDTAADACRTDCTAARCGDGAIDTGEECDRGDDNSDTAADACRTDCTAARCGDGVVDAGEECDEGAGNSDSAADACRTSCVRPRCGDGVVDAGEECDDGESGSASCTEACTGVEPDGGAPAVDAGPPVADAGAPAADAAPPVTDGGADAGAPSVTDGGCGCAAAGSQRPVGSAGWLALLAAVAGWRRRSRRGAR
jgi:hypothetical protein